MSAIHDYTHIIERIAERAYYKWLNGSTDDYKNWCDSVKEEFVELVKFKEMKST